MRIGRKKQTLITRVMGGRLLTEGNLQPFLASEGQEQAFLDKGTAGTKAQVQEDTALKNLQV